jgi:hypothetical protein
MHKGGIEINLRMVVYESICDVQSYFAFCFVLRFSNLEGLSFAIVVGRPPTIIEFSSIWQAA